MSLIVTFNGQFKPYSPIKITDSNRVKKLSLVAPTFNDLIHQYLSLETVEDQTFLGRENQQEKKADNDKIKQFLKNSGPKKKRFYAKDIMTQSIVSLKPEDSINDALQVMGTKQIHHVPILEDSVMKGIVSDKLLLKALADDLSIHSPLRSVMKEKVLTALEHSSISDIARAMLDEKISCVPVTDGKLSLKGIVTTTDMLSLLMLSFPLDIYS